MRLKEKTLRTIEFMVVGVLMGLVEDLLAVWFATGEAITPDIVLIVFLVALPFAFISAVVVDHPRFWAVLFRVHAERG